jgi:glycosyltransferase involved in cell wall biosynthesis
MKVSVCMLTYNHERFIAQAIESTIGQMTDFDYELVIGEDASTDRTREICEQYAAQHPGRIRLLTREHNLGMMDNFVRTWQACSGEYIALLDGDDYWIAQNKLQLQVDLLDANPAYAMCFTDAVCLDEQSGSVAYYLPKPGDVSETANTVTLIELFRGNFIATCTAMIRRGQLSVLPEWFSKLGMGDWPLYLLTVQHGDAGYIRKSTGCYRLHASATYSNQDEIAQYKIGLAVYEALEGPLGTSNAELILEMKILWNLSVARRYLSNGDFTHAYHYLRSAFALMLPSLWFSPFPFRIATTWIIGKVKRLSAKRRAPSVMR